MAPLISVIVPVYKAETYLHRCVDSLLAQSFQDYEILLIDDGSPDKSGNICDEYAKQDNRIRVFHKENGGVSSARNVGLDNAIGDYISFVDSDDWVNNDFLEIFLMNKADIVVQGVYATNWPEKEKDIEHYIGIEEINVTKCDVSCLFDALFDSLNIGFVFLRLFKRSIIETNQIRFNTDYKLMEDEEFIMHYLIYCTTYSTINKSGYHYILPNFKEKYKDLDVMDNVKCSMSIVKYIRKISNLYEGKLLVRSLNHFAFCIWKVLEKKNIKDNQFVFYDLRFYLNEYCKYAKFVNKNKLNKRNLLLLFLAKTYMPLFVLQGCGFLFSKKIYSKYLELL